MANRTVRLGVIGTGGQARGVHIDGYLRCPDAQVVAICDTNTGLLAETAEHYGITRTFPDYRELLARADVDAVSICTPNDVHKPIALAAIAAGKHVLCEKPLAFTFADAREMYDAAERAGVRHMTAFTYRFVPAMRYLHDLLARGDIGQPTQLRSRRLQDWGNRSIGWRQHRSTAGTGELGDMASHRIDYGNYLLGQVDQVSGLTKTFLPERRGLQGIDPTDVDDWTAFMAEYESGAVGVFESTKLAFGRGSGSTGHDELEVCGPDGAFLYELGKPHELLVAKPTEPYRKLDVPAAYLSPAGAPSSFTTGDPLTTFRYGQAWEFISAIREGRACRPSFADGMRCQAIMDAIMLSSSQRRWIPVER